MRFGLILACVLGLSTPLAAETLADIQQDLKVLGVELKKLKRELSTTGASGVTLQGSQLDRITSIESELQRVTAKTEELEHRIMRIAKDGSNRLGDLQFRICELEEGCDLGAIGQADPLGGEAIGSLKPSRPEAPDAVSQLAVREQADFIAAQQALDAGDMAKAAQLFAYYRETYPSGPLDAQALVGEGLALQGTGDTREAARRFLSAYSSHPNSDAAPEALWRLGVALNALGSKREACVTLQEVGTRYGSSEFAAKAKSSLSELGCT